MTQLILPRNRATQPQNFARLSDEFLQYNPRFFVSGALPVPINKSAIATTLNSFPSSVGRFGKYISGYEQASVALNGEIVHPPSTIIAYIVIDELQPTGAYTPFGFVGSGDAYRLANTPYLWQGVLQRNYSGPVISSAPSGSAAPLSDKQYIVALVSNSDTDHQLYVYRNDGGYEEIASTTSTASISFIDSTTLYLGQNNYTKLYWGGFFDKALPKNLIDSLISRPFEVFEPEKRIVYFDVGGGGGAYTLVSADGSFTLSGQTAGLLANRTLASNAASYSLSGQIAALLAGRSITSEASSFTLAGQTASLLADKLLTATTGSFTLNGQNATLTYVPNSAAYVLTAADGTFLFSGQSAQLIARRLLTSSEAAFTLAGQDAALLAGRKLTSSEAAFTLDGVTTPLLAGRLLTASEASYSLTGQTATLIYTPVGAYILAANAATYSVSGQDALLLHNRILTGAEGSFTVTGINAGMFRGLKLSAGTSAFLLSGQDITFTYTQGYTLTCATGSYALSGQDAALIADRILTLSAAGFTLTGKDAALRTGVAVPVAIGDPDWQIVIKAFDFRTIVEGDDHRVIIH